ncbi:class II aldolase/adducin domain-containing protein [Morchella conica CCBAS932]|uniref:Class II aldolase/adducin domain-containing protein n=1 Tax=Morchella conica CCBAS932 TaxID=1392247 RepID=A0A3N4KWQ0_9PEZI|nr:class II aldolase/adducin domain-containing protein [Morchella conica CCBAS932]
MSSFKGGVDSQGYSFPTTTDITTSPFYKLASGRTRPVLPSFENPAEESIYRKEHLAAVFRVLGKHGHGEGIAGHCSVRDAVKPDCFWVNPWTKSFSRMKASDLMLVNHAGEVVEGDRAIDASATSLHSALHEANPSLIGIVHVHGPYSKAFSALGRQLDMINQDSCVFHNSHVLVPFGGLIQGRDEGVRISKLLGGESEGLKKIAVLENHGALAFGQSSIDEAAWWFLNFEMCCRAQLLFDSAVGRNQTGKIPEESRVKIIGGTEREFTKFEMGSPEMGWLNFAPYYEDLEWETKGDFKN